LQKLDILDFLGLAYAGGAERVYTSWEPEKIDENGRITQVLLKGKKPKSLPGHEFYSAIKKQFGPNSIKSMSFNMDILRRTIIFRGMGQGDGVGLCLYGADGLAKKNQKYTDILKFYYPGTELK
jgi:stage II sporulation protein D